MTTYRFSANYQMTDQVAVEGGYLGSTHTDDDTDYETKYNGFFLGARAAF